MNAMRTSVPLIGTASDPLVALTGHLLEETGRQAGLHLGRKVHVSDCLECSSVSFSLSFSLVLALPQLRVST